MNYKEALYFVSKCLTISLEDKNRFAIEKQLQSNLIDWDSVVKISTAHYVLPAIYCNFKKVDFLKYLPKDLLNYMEYIVDLNRERNKKIVIQARELNSLLLSNNIIPIFLKGTGNLLAGIYDDIAERMVGDIDFLVSEKEFINTIKILKNNIYKKEENQKDFSTINLHYTRLVKKGNIAAVEIHKEITLEKYSNEFNFSFIEKNIQIIKGCTVLNYANKLNLSIIANQINDYGFYYKTIELRNAYDVFLLSKKTSAKDAVNTLNKLTNTLNCFLAACYEVFNNVDSLEYNRTKKAASYLRIFNSQFINSLKTKRRHKRISIYLSIKFRLNILFKAVTRKEYRVWFIKKLTDKNWYIEKGIQLGIINSINK